MAEHFCYILIAFCTTQFTDLLLHSKKKNIAKHQYGKISALLLEITGRYDKLRGYWLNKLFKNNCWTLMSVLWFLEGSITNRKE